VLPGFDPVLPLDGRFIGWLEWLEELGYGTLKPGEALRSEPDRPAEHSASAFLSNGLISWIDRQEGPWFAHASYLRPHFPYAAAGEFATRYSLEEVGEPIPAVHGLHPLYDFALGNGLLRAPEDPTDMARLRAQYLGMVSEVDHQLGRVVEHLRSAGTLDDTLVVVTSDHGEQLGDHGLVWKLGFFEESYRIPCIVRHPGRPVQVGRVVTEYTEGIDILPTLAELLGQEVPTQCDGASLVPFLDGSTPGRWRVAAHYEWDWRDIIMGPTRTSGGPDAKLERYNLAVERNDTHAYVHFSDGSWLCFDIAADPTWCTTTTDPEQVLPLAQSMLTWRSTHLGGTYTQRLLGPERRGLWPELETA
jgi:arylsulfatase A-like enzyme